jgi:DNA-binding MarR family transcriptional regulator
VAVNKGERPLGLLGSVWSAEAELSTPQAAVLTVLILHRNNETELCFPSVTTIAKETHQTRRGVMKQLRRLDDLGVIEVERRRGARNRYRLDLSKLPTGERG